MNLPGMSRSHYGQGTKSERYTNMNTSRINARELCSRKLWQLAETSTRDQISADELADVIAELAKRCHDLDQLRHIDQLKDAHQG